MKDTLFSNINQPHKCFAEVPWAPPGRAGPAGAPCPQAAASPPPPGWTRGGWSAPPSAPPGMDGEQKGLFY